MGKVTTPVATPSRKGAKRGKAAQAKAASKIKKKVIVEGKVGSKADMSKPAINYLDQKVGVYKQTKKGGYWRTESLPLREVLTKVAKKEAGKIKRYRATKDKAVKARILAYSPAGDYGEQSRAAATPLLSSTNLVQLDFDGQAGDIRGLFDRHKFIAVIGKSASGNGMYMLVNTPGEDYEGYFHALVDFFKTQENLNVDLAVSSINELRYCGLPEECLFREDATVWTGTKPKPKSSFDLALPSKETKTLDISHKLKGKLHYTDLSSFAGRSISFGVPMETAIAQWEAKADWFYKGVPPSHLYNNPKAIRATIEKHYRAYEHQFGTLLQKFTALTEIDFIEPKGKGYEFNREAWDLFTHKKLFRHKKEGLYVSVKDNVATIFEYSRQSYKTTMFDLISNQITVSQEVRTMLFELLPNVLGALEIFDDSVINKDTRTASYIHYKDKTVMVTAKGAEEIEGRAGVVWATQIIPHPAPTGKPSQSIIEGLMRKATDDPEYFMRCIGYLLHRKKSRTLAIAPVFYGVGGNYKGLLVAQTVSKVRNTIPISARREDPSNPSRFLFGPIRPDHDVIIFDECKPGFESELNSLVTDQLLHEQKNVKQEVWDFHDYGKCAMITNFPVNIEDPAVARRYPINHMKEVVQGRNGKSVFDDFTPDEWRDFYSYIQRALAAYLKDPVVEVKAELSETLKKDWGRVKYGSDILDVIEMFRKDSAIPAATLNEALDIPLANARLKKFLEAFEYVTGRRLVKVRDGNQYVYKNQYNR